MQEKCDGIKEVNVIRSHNLEYIYYNDWTKKDKKLKVDKTLHTNIAFEQQEPIQWIDVLLIL